MDERGYNRHYILIRLDGAIIDAWSDGPHPEKNTDDAICINSDGSYQFSFHPGGEMNPFLFDTDGITPIYKWDGAQVVHRTEKEIEADRAAIPAPAPSPQEQLRADIDFIAVMTGVSL